MKLRIIGVGLVFISAIGILLLIITLTNPSTFTSTSVSTVGTSTGTHTSATATSNGTTSNDSIARENAQPGTTSWQITAAHASTVQIQAFAGATSVVPGSSIKLYVSTQRAGTLYTIDIYRLGWYGGTGARLMQSIPALSGDDQGYFDNINDTQSTLVCPSCTTDKATGLLETHWKASYTLSIPNNWTTGIYLAKFTDSQGFQTYAPFDVLGNPNAPYVLVTPDTTAAAYNNWGGSSLYEVDNEAKGQGVPVSPGAGVAAVSFNRPYSDGYGSGIILSYELTTIHWLERQGYEISYISSVDLQTNPAQLLNHKAFISLGHDEYWTKEMRDGVENARDHGVGLAFLGANTAYWQMRFGPDSNGTENRIVICYKVLSDNKDYQRDPLYGKDNSRVTTQWRDPLVNRPEDALTGVMFSDLTHYQSGFAWRVDPQAGNSPLLKGTGLQAGQSYGCGIVGYEWDKDFNDATTPKNLQLIASSPVVPSNSAGTPSTTRTDMGNSAYYIAPSGAFVFASGSIYWGNSLDDFRADYNLQSHSLARACNGDATTSKAVPEIQKFMANVMSAMIVKHPSGTL
ncbi:MAG TPA: N,N-dimethylformamidase beta subunit family domain-containing protein [Ktedonobacteraceae bacterium]|nr:N,N-dimethylformamidase beta subunit family domain-containing protein [Ktedonobacteraceae bacterium]